MTEKKNNHTMSQMTHEHHMDHDHNMSMMADSEIDMSAMPMHHHGADMGMAGMDMNDMKRRFWISLILMIPILFISPFMGVNLPFTVVFPGNAWVSALLAAMLYVIGSQPFWVGARQELQAKKPAMMSLITMGLNVTFWYSIYALIATQVFHHHVMDFFWEFATLTVIMLLGHRIEMSATMKAGDATAKLRELLPQIAHVKHGDHIMDMPITTLKSNMVVRVLAGESFPADGIVINGNSQVDESLMTGESQLIDKSTEATVYGGTINGNGTLEVKLTTVGAQSFIGQLQQTLLTSQDKKSQVETLADRVASWLFWVALVFALGALIIWTPLRGFGFATNIAVTVLVIACPHALGLAVPLVISRTKAIAAAQGILIKNRKALSSANQLQYALMDKTGTLTTGQFTVQQLVAYQDDQSHVLAIMSALDQQSTHPLAQSIISYAQSQGAPTLSAQHVENIAGYGVSGMIEDNHYLLVSARYLTEHHIDFEPLNTDGSVSYLLNHDKVIAAIAQGDSVKESARQFIDDLHAQHIIPVLVTGDNEKSAKRVAHELGIEAIHAGVSPQEKIALVAEYQKRGAVMMIGDGINDAPALAHADLSVAIGAGTQVAQASADTVLITNHLPKIIEFIRLAKHGNTKQVQNLWWGAGYNIITIPLAAGALSFIGLMLNPMIGAIVMSFSTIVVALNALTLKG